MKKCSFLILTVLFFSLSAFAQQNLINSVMISKSKEVPGKYELSIDSTDTVKYKMHNDEQGVWFELKNSVLADNAGTIYDDVSDIDSVTVKNSEKNKVNIYLRGKNVENTELLFINSLFDTKKDSSKQIKLAGPVTNYQSTDYRDDLEDDGAEWSDNSFSISHLGVNTLENLKNGPLGIALVIITFLAILTIIVRILAQKMSQDSEPLIGLNNNYAKDSALIRDLNHTKALQDAQTELSKAHSKYQDYLKNKYQNNVKTQGADIVSKTIALNQYQKSNNNPYSEQKVIKINKDFTSRDNFQIPPKPKAIKPEYTTKPQTSKTEFTSPYIKRSSGNIELTAKKEKQPNNMKFLESVTKIYEQSGRNDLAQELRSSMSKIK